MPTHDADPDRPLRHSPPWLRLVFVGAAVAVVLLVLTYVLTARPLS